MASVDVDVTVGAVVRPGDTLILLGKHRYSAADLAAVRQQIETRLPGVKVAVLEGFEQAAIYRPELTDEEAAELREKWVTQHGHGARDQPVVVLDEPPDVTR